MVRTKQTGCKTGTKDTTGLSAGGQKLAVSGGGDRASPGTSTSRPTRCSPHPPASTGFTLGEETENEPTTATDRSCPNKRGRQDPSPSLAPSNKPRRQLPPRKSMKDMSMKELCREWNKRAQIGLQCETMREWLKKSQGKRNKQGQRLKRAQPGVRALREIRHYQRCRTFLIAVIPFQRLVREVCDDPEVRGTGLHWQSNALFTLQGATEAYMSGFFHDVN